MGPMVSETQRNIVLGFIEKGKAEGATLSAGGNTITSLGPGDNGGVSVLLSLAM